MKDRFHEPVLVSEVIEYLAPGDGKVMVDATIGGGGHARAVLDRPGAGGGMIEKLIGIDLDPEALDFAAGRLKEHQSRVSLHQGSFEDLPGILAKEGLEKVDGVLLDLGVSLHQLTKPERGFGIREDGPLDMRMDPAEGESAAGLLKRLGEKEMADLIYKYGEERFSRRIARAIVQRREEGRPVETTGELARLVERAVSGKRGKIHPATRTFQALRIAVNRELSRLETALCDIPGLLAPEGRAVIISYHSLEDRRVKQSFQKEAKGCTCPPGQPVCTCEARTRLQVLTRKPVRPGEDEIGKNPAARSARLRAARKLPEKAKEGKP